MARPSLTAPQGHSHRRGSNTTSRGDRTLQTSIVPLTLPPWCTTPSSTQNTSPVTHTGGTQCIQLTALPSTTTVPSTTPQHESNTLRCTLAVPRHPVLPRCLPAHKACTHTHAHLSQQCQEFTAPFTKLAVCNDKRGRERRGRFNLHICTTQ